MRRCRHLRSILATALLSCLPAIANAQDTVPAPRRATLDEAALVAAQGVPLEIAKDMNAPYSSRLVSVENAGDCNPQSEACSDDWYLAVSQPVAAGQAVLYFLGSFGSILAPVWAAPGGTASTIRLSIQWPSIGVIPGRPGPAKLRRVVEYSIGLDTVYVLSVNRSKS
jgi:hypothetical protein